MTDRMTVLRCHDSMVLTKTHTSTASGIATESYGKAKTFTFWVEHVDSLDDIYQLLGSLARQHHACVIRGEPAIEFAAQIVQRRCIPRDGEPAPFSSAQPGRRWCAFDFDDFPLAYAASMDSATIAAAVRASMPHPWRDAATVYRLSASAGVNGWDKVSLHLWFWLDRPVFDKSLKNYAKSRGLGDSSLFSAVQVHYTADPIFIGMDDPVKQRLGMLPGEPVVKVPAELLDAVAFAESEKPTPQPTPLIQYGDDRQKSAQEKYAEKALQSAAADIRAQGKGNRNPEAHKQAYSIGGYVGAGVLDGVYAGQVLTAAIQSVVGPDRYAKEADTVQRGILDGAANPRDMSRIGLGREPRRHRQTEDVTHIDHAREVEEATTLLETATTAAGRKAGAKALGIAKRKEKAASGGSPMFVGTRDDGSNPTTQENVRALLDFYGVDYRYNAMSRVVDINIPAAVSEGVLCNAPAAAIRRLARKHGIKADAPAFRDELLLYGVDNAYHPVADWIRATPWDGVDRFEALWASIVIREEGLADVGLYRAMLRAWLVAGAMCAMLPLDSTRGVSTHGVLVLQGKQGCGKTTWLTSLVPRRGAWIKDGVSIDPAQKDSVAGATSSWLVELGELDQTVRKADMAGLKAFITAPVDSYRRPYAEASEDHPRRTNFAASVNSVEFLKDDTGNRRFWVLPIEACMWRETEPNSVASIDLQQLWAQFAQHAVEGELHVLATEWDVAQRASAERHRIVNATEDELKELFEVDVDAPKAFWTATSAIYYALYPNREPHHWTSQEKMGVSVSLKAMGAVSGNGRSGRTWSVKRRM